MKNKTTTMPGTTKYVPVYQNMGVNTLAFLADGITNSPELKGGFNSEGQLEYEKDGILYKIDVSKKFMPVRVHQFLLYFISKYTRNVRQGASDARSDKYSVMEVSFQELAEVFGVNVKQAKIIAVQSASSLRQLSIRTHWQTERDEIYEETGILYNYRLRTNRVTRKGFIEVTFSERFRFFMKYMSVMMFPTTLWKIIPKNNPYTYRFGYWIAINLKMNFGKRNWNRVSVNKLLDIAETLPKRYELGKAAQVHKRIIAPVIRDLDALVQYGFLTEWYFEHQMQRIPIEEYNRLKYDTFIDCRVVCYFSGKPEKIYLESAKRNARSAKTGSYKSKTGNTMS